MLHIALHFIVPLLPAVLIGRRHWWRVWLVLCATMLVDADHLLADPIYDPLRCSINFHPLHRLPVIGLYALALWPRASRLPALGLLIHMGLDSLDCYTHQGIWFTSH
ncbi:DUF6122 family protein [Granulosicoccaceae sp. 1_MG-2023]|nr:DUF6122 family protein [Granulosicoccaceae sp. 1_MG-2023]